MKDTSGFIDEGIDKYDNGFEDLLDVGDDEKGRGRQEAVFTERPWV